MKTIYTKCCVLSKMFYTSIITYLMFIISALLISFISYQVNILSVAVTLMSIQLFLAIINIIFYQLTLLTDPGIMPSNNRMEYFTPLYVQDLKFHSGNFKYLNQCATCQLDKPPGCSHCAKCDHCIVYSDHHCPWMGCCIGLRNYLYFIIAIFISFIYCVFSVGLCIYNIIQIFTKFEIGIFKEKITPTIISSLFILILLYLISFCGFVILRQLKLIIKNQTTRADIFGGGNINNKLKISFQKGDYQTLTEMQQRLEGESGRIARIKMHPGLKRIIYGHKMPILRNLSANQAEDIAWEWTIAFYK